LFSPAFDFLSEVCRFDSYDFSAIDSSSAVPPEDNGLRGSMQAGQEEGPVPNQVLPQMPPQQVNSYPPFILSAGSFFLNFRLVWFP